MMSFQLLLKINIVVEIRVVMHPRGLVRGANRVKKKYKK